MNELFDELVNRINEKGIEFCIIEFKLLNNMK